MNTSDSADCGEWSLYTHGTVQATAKHLDMKTNDSVLYEDIATTLDGGPEANATAAAASLLGCGTDGGSMGVLANTSNQVYASKVYKELSAVPEGIFIKVVAT